MKFFLRMFAKFMKLSITKTRLNDYKIVVYGKKHVLFELFYDSEQKAIYDINGYEEFPFLNVEVEIDGKKDTLFNAIENKIIDQNV